MNTLREIGLSPQEFFDIKQEFANETKLGEGAHTCFGSLVWCCKPSKPCPLRDMTLRNMGMSYDEYLDLKKELAEKFKEANGFLKCRDLLGLDKEKKESPMPSERTKEYYAKRPCAEIVRNAAQIWAEYEKKK